MPKPDDDHTCQLVTDADGTVIASVHAEPGALVDPRFSGAMADLIAAACRRWDADPDRAEMDARQDAARERNRARLARIRGENA
jgi:hypothetical protein